MIHHNGGNSEIHHNGGKIPPMAIHPLEDIHALVTADAWHLGTRTCRDKVRDIGMTRQDVAACLLSLTAADFQREFGDATTDFGVVQADAYSVEFDGLWLYVKFGVHSNENGDQCVIASFHPTN